MVGTTFMILDMLYEYDSIQQQILSKQTKIVNCSKVFDFLFLGYIIHSMSENAKKNPSLKHSITTTKEREEF